MDSQIEEKDLKEVVDTLALAVSCNELKIKLREWIQHASKQNRLTTYQWATSVSSLEFIEKYGLYTSDSSKAMMRTAIETVQKSIEMFEEIYSDVIEENKRGNFHESGFFDPCHLLKPKN